MARRRDVIKQDALIQATGHDGGVQPRRQIAFDGVEHAARRASAEQTEVERLGNRHRVGPKVSKGHAPYVGIVWERRGLRVARDGVQEDRIKRVGELANNCAALRIQSTGGWQGQGSRAAARLSCAAHTSLGRL